MTISEKNSQAFLDAMHGLLEDPAFFRVARYQQERNWSLCLGLKEVHYCRILQWLLSPNEGHGLGDFFLKRLLMAASRGVPAALQENWFSLDQLATINLNAAIIETEVVLDPGNGHNQRLDLLIVDPVQRVVVGIERKDGASLGIDQLDPYERWIRSAYPDYRKLFLLSDHYEQDHGLADDSAWMQLGDDWLVEALNESLIPGRLSRDMQQRLEDIVAHFDYENPYRDAHFSGITEELEHLSMVHRKALKQLGDNPVSNLSATDIIARHLGHVAKSPDDARYRALRFRLQYGRILDELAECNVLQALQSRLQTLYPIDRLCFEMGHHYLDISTQRLEAICEADETLRYWPVYLTLRFPAAIDQALEKDEEPTEQPLPSITLELDMFALGEGHMPQLCKVAEEKGMTTRKRYASRTEPLPSVEELWEAPAQLQPWLDGLSELAAIVEVRTKA